MALKQTKTVHVPVAGEIEIDAHISVIHVSGTSEHAVCNVRTRRNSKEGGIVSDDVYEFTPDMDGPNFIKQAYQYIKTLPEFASAEDV